MSEKIEVFTFGSRISYSLPMLNLSKIKHSCDKKGYNNRSIEIYLAILVLNTVGNCPQPRTHCSTIDDVTLNNVLKCFELDTRMHYLFILPLVV